MRKKGKAENIIFRSRVIYSLDMIKINLKYCLLYKILEFTHIKKFNQTLNKIEPPP